MNEVWTTDIPTEPGQYWILAPGISSQPHVCYVLYLGDSEMQITNGGYAGLPKGCANLKAFCNDKLYWTPCSAPKPWPAR